MFWTPDRRRPPERRHPTLWRRRSQSTLREHEENEFDQEDIDENDEQRRGHDASGRRSPYARRPFIRGVAEKRRDRPDDQPEDGCFKSRRVEVGPLEGGKRSSEVQL